MASLVDIFASLLLLASAILAYGDPMACSGTCNNTHDPSLIRRDDGTYFRFSTGGKVAIHSASNITGPWRYLGAAIPAGSSINLAGNDDLWAPDVHKIGNTYYMYYAVSTFGSQASAIGYATSADLETWKDQGSTGISSAAGNQYNAIDPNLLMDGSSYSMIFGSFFGDIFQVPMSSPSAASGFAAQIAFNATTNHSEEGAYMYKNGAYWYLFFSSGQCCGLDTSKPAPGEEYKIMVCRSTSSIGPFSDKSGNACTSNGGTIVLPSHGNVYAPGGQGVYDDPQLGAVLYYHYVNIPDGYSDGAKLFGINVIDWTSGWPVV